MSLPIPQLAQQLLQNMAKTPNSKWQTAIPTSTVIAGILIAWPWASTAMTRFETLENQNRELLERIAKLETRLDTISTALRLQPPR